MEMVNVGSVPAMAPVRSRFGDVALLVFLLAQLGDGVLTYIGVTTFGRAIEGNPIIGWLMDSVGHGPGLAAAKIAAASFGVALYMSAVHKAVAALAAFYIVVAIAPWVVLLYVWG
jgi:hypothetical protein